MTVRVDAGEEVRAALYRTMRGRRDAFQRALSGKLAGDPNAAQQVRDDWQPLTDALHDLRNPEQPADDDAGQRAN